MKLYEERLLSTVVAGVLVLVLLAFVAVLFLDVFVGIASPPFSMVMGVLVIIFVGVILNFMFIRLTLTDEYVRVSYGLFSARRRWKDVRAVEVDEKHYFYGYGVRLGRYKKQWAWVFNSMGDKRVVFITKGRFSLIVSTKNPQRVVQVSRKCVEK